ncbi:TlpA family protein disulfide reductase [Kaistella flava (ex Peng et al. 2021)]|uniref:TlpA family protein disulfide reductase n=1 Tax=Kaistella flava (ex Peng et al. 2021) TaxID=2038776 RepID=A0A7M2Y6S2_9FLAO|nr:TlpA disulfide reductase family protein [Kaistella flava (ex Peng et al. 2021)]QOW09861.1 TlpA family protein disulfide reductase [Kaistella flava (ex Peng et al. 2021)]
MKATLTVLTILISILSFSQTKVYKSPNGKILSQEEYKKAKISSLENMKKMLGADYELYEKLEVSKKTNSSILYSFEWEFLNEEMHAEKLVLEKLLGTKIDFKNLNFLVHNEKNNVDYKKPTFVNFWFTTCPPCIEELPALNELKNKYQDKINFVSITFDSSEKVEKFLTKYEFNFIHIVGEKDFINSHGFNGYPKTFLLDKNQILKSVTGSLPSKKDENAYNVQMKLMEEALQKLL